MSVTTEIVEPNGGTRRHSTGGIIARGSLSSSNRNEKSLPNYLRAPKSSCHDYCKYGRKHNFEAEAKHPFLRKKVHHEDPCQVNSLKLEERGKRLVTKMKSSSQAKPKVFKQKALPQFKESKLMEEQVDFNFQSPSPSHKSTTAGEQIILSISLENEQIQFMNKDDRKVKQESEPKTSAQTKSFCPKLVDQDLSLDNENEAHGTPNIIRKEPALPLQKACPSIKPDMLKKTPAKGNTKPDEHQRFKQKALVPSRMVDTSAKPAMPLKINKTTATRLKSPLTTLGLNGHRNEAYKIRNSRVITKMAEKKILKTQVPSQSCKPSGSSLNPRKYRHGNQTNIMKNKEAGTAKPDKENDEEKTIYVVEPKADSVGSNGLTQRLPNAENVHFVSITQTPWKSENDEINSLRHKSPESECVDLYFLEQKSPNAEKVDLNCLQQKSIDGQSSQSVSYGEEETEESDSEYTESSELVSENEETKSSSDSKSLRSEERRLRTTPIIHPEDNPSTPYKLRFRRGKVIDSQPESNGPTRLRFRRGRVVGESGNGGQVRRKNFRRTLTDDAVSKDDPEAATVVLRHQDMHEKKDTQGLLFNNVIEETASKLVESRKSKVKALVGAFETVISLQDGKPASTI